MRVFGPAIDWKLDDVLFHEHHRHWPDTPEDGPAIRLEQGIVPYGSLATTRSASLLT
jgi:hypothetical protein